MSKGFLIIAQNNDKDDYLACARVLAKSLKKTNPHIPICLLTDKPIEDSIYDHIVLFPHGDQSTSEWKLQNDWQCYDASPFDETIKIEADILVTRNLDTWWAECASYDLLIATGCRNFYQEVSDIKFYRRLFVENNLPDTYNGITYFKKSNLAKEFFDLVKSIFQNWDDIKSTLKGDLTNENGSTDLVYAIAADIIGREKCTSLFNSIQFVHMKRMINELVSDEWDEELTWEVTDDSFRISGITQHYPVHYYVKRFANKVEKYYG